MQYLIAYTSNSDILHNGEWTTNGAGLPVSHKFGFGAIDAEAMVTRARRWTNVPEQLTFQEQFTDSLGYAIHSQSCMPMTIIIYNHFIRLVCSVHKRCMQTTALHNYNQTSNVCMAV